MSDVVLRPSCQPLRRVTRTLGEDMTLSIFSSYLKARSLDLCKAIRQPVSDLVVYERNGYRFNQLLIFEQKHCVRESESRLVKSLIPVAYLLPIVFQRLATVLEKLDFSGLH